ncbi:MAG: nucleoside triphosphate pyrophosphohydrolase [Actinomycetota bacterium]
MPDPDPSAHLSSAVPSSRHGERLLDLVRVMATLRGPGGCPWDHEQTHRTLGRHLLEEAHEALEAIDAGDDDALRDELGDVLLQVVFHAQIAADEGSWDVDDVAEAIVAKLIRRHPHVFGDVEVSGAGEVLTNWEQIKAGERAAAGHSDRRQRVDEDIPATLPALARAGKVQRRAAGAGFDWRSADGAIGKLREELEELTAAVSDDAGPDAIGSELGDVLLAAVSVARRLDVDPEGALRRSTARFADRYEAMRDRAEDEGVDLAAMDDEELLVYYRASRDR